MSENKIKKNLYILKITSIKQLEEKDLDFWHQKRFIEIQKSGQDKNTISKSLIELNNAKENLDKYDLKTLKTKISTNKEQTSKEKENFARKYINILYEQKFETTKDSRGFEFKKIKKQWILISIILFFIPLVGLYNQLKYGSNLESEIEITKEKNIEKGKFNLKIGNYALARNYFTKEIKKDPNNAEIYFYRGLSENKIGNYDSAILDYSRAINLNPKLFFQIAPDLSTAYYNLGGENNPNYPLYFKQNRDYNIAINDYTKAIEIYPSNTKAYIQRGRTYIGLGNYELAKKDLSRSIMLEPNNEKALFYRGIARIESGLPWLGCLDIKKAFNIKGFTNLKQSISKISFFDYGFRLSNDYIASEMFASKQYKCKSNFD